MQKNVDWIKKIPKNWEVTTIGRVLDERNKKNTTFFTDNILSLSVNQGVVPYDEYVGGGNKAKEDISKYKVVLENDIVMNSMNVIAGSVNLSKYIGCVSPVYYILYTKKEKDNVKYFNYVFQTKEFQKSLYGLGNGIMIKESSNGKLNTIRMKIPMEKLTSVIIPYPNSVTQERIVKHLDDVCIEIESVIFNTLETIKEYKKLKDTLINCFIFEGLEKTVNKKDSNIDFVGKIPIHWNVSYLKHIATKLKRPLKDEHNMLICSNHGKVKLRPDNCSGLVSLTENGYQGVMPGDLLIHGMDTWHGAIALSYMEGKCTSVVHVCQTKQNKEFLVYYLRALATKKVYKGISSGVRENTSDFRSWDKAGSIPVILPPIEEQNNIVEHLNNCCSEIDKLIENKQKIIKDLNDYKKAVIYNCVSGKVEL